MRPIATARSVVRPSVVLQCNPVPAEQRTSDHEIAETVNPSVAAAEQLIDLQTLDFEHWDKLAYDATAAWSGKFGVDSCRRSEFGFGRRRGHFSRRRLGFVDRRRYLCPGRFDRRVDSGFDRRVGDDRGRRWLISLFDRNIGVTDVFLYRMAIAGTARHPQHLPPLKNRGTALLTRAL